MATTATIEAISPALARGLAVRAQQFRDVRDAQLNDQRWPLSLDVRGLVVKLALEMTGLKLDDDGTITPVEPTDKKPPEKPRDRLAAMRVIATCDKLDIEQRKVDLLENPSLADDHPLTPGEVLNTMKMTPTARTRTWDLIADQFNQAHYENRFETVRFVAVPGVTLVKGEDTGDTVAPPPGLCIHDGLCPEHETGPCRCPIRIERNDQDSWPLTRLIRCEVITSALGLCGYTITPEGQLVALPLKDGMAKPKRRIVLGALRMLTRFDRLSILERLNWHAKRRSRRARRNQSRPGGHVGVCRNRV